MSDVFDSRLRERAARVLSAMASQPQADYISLLWSFGADPFSAVHALVNRTYWQAARLTGGLGHSAVSAYAESMLRSGQPT